jgi:hypothetical protein
MSAELYRELSWLPRPPEDFSSRCKDLLTTGAELGAQIRFLATHALDERQLSRLGRAIVAAREQVRSLQPLAPFRLGLIGNGTLDLMVPVLIATAARHGFARITGAYDQFLQDALQPDSRLNTFRPDAVLVALDHRELFVTLALLALIRTGLGETSEHDTRRANARWHIELSLVRHALSVFQTWGEFLLFRRSDKSCNARSK